MQSDLTDIPFEQATDTHSIDLRLHPIDVGSDCRVQKMLLAVPPGDYLRASYPREDGERFVLAGPRDAVVARLAELGFEFAGVART